MAGTVRIEEVGEALGCVLEHPDVDSVSGLVLTMLGRPPAVGDVVEYDHVRFEVTAVHRRGVREMSGRASRAAGGVRFVTIVAWRCCDMQPASDAAALSAANSVGRSRGCRGGC